MQIKQQELEIKQKELAIKEQEIMLRLEEIRMQKELRELEILAGSAQNQEQEQESEDNGQEKEKENGMDSLEMALLQGNSVAIQGLTSLLQGKKNITINRDNNGLMSSVVVNPEGVM